MLCHLKGIGSGDLAGPYFKERVLHRSKQQMVVTVVPS